MPLRIVPPTRGATVKPVLSRSKFKYLVGWLSMALATPSEPGLLLEEATIGSPGVGTSVSASTPSNSTSETCIQQVLLPAVFGKIRRYCAYGTLLPKRIVTFLKQLVPNAGTVPAEIWVKVTPS